jgi:F0F1-type ATP synthase membrane subunit b/b'
MNNLLISIILCFVSVAFLFFSWRKERISYKRLKHLQKIYDGKGRERLKSRAEDLAEAQFKKNIKQLSQTLKSTAKTAMEENFNHLSQEIAREKELLLQRAREEVDNYKISEIRKIQEASQEAVLEVARKMMLGKISVTEDKEYILNVLDQFINDIKK